MRVAVLKGGISSERDVSLVSGEACAEALRGEHVLKAVGITVANGGLFNPVMGDRALAVTEIIPQTDWYDYEAKYSEGGSKHVVPAEIPENITEICLEWALKAHKALGCKGLSRADYRFNEKKDDFDSIVNKIVMLEVNTQPGMTPVSLAPEQATYAGVSFGQLCRWLVEDASWPR